MWMKKSIKYMLVGGMLWLLWGSILIPFSVAGLAECRGRSFQDIINDNLINGLRDSPVIVLLFIPTIIPLAISCSLGGSLFISTLLPPIIGFFYGALIGFIICKIVNQIQRKKNGGYSNGSTTPT
jgi:hypothetical protein